MSLSRSTKICRKKARMITFHKNLQRIHPWIKTLKVFYYNSLQKKEDFEINWYDDPEVWESRSDSSNSIVIKVMQMTNLLYSVIFLLQHAIFADKHFSILKQFLDKVLALQTDERECSGKDIPYSPLIVHPVMTGDDTAVKTLNATDTVRVFQR